MPAYKHILFDLDHTLWDFDANCNETLTELYHQHHFNKINLLLPLFLIEYKNVNRDMWHNYHKGLIDKEALRNNRFIETFKKLGINSNLIPFGLNEQFMKLCPMKGHLIPFAQELLRYLQPRYKIHIVTNGFKESQQIKLNTSNIASYFDQVIHSEICGYLKPHKKIFEYTLTTINAACHECVMIGDDLEADVLGAKNAGIDSIFFNRYNDPHKESMTHEIKCLSELFKLL